MTAEDRWKALATRLGVELKSIRTKQDTVQGWQLPAPPGGYIYPQGVLTYGTGSPVDQRITLFPIFLNKGTYDSFHVNQTTAMSAGSTARLYAALYQMPADLFVPDTNAGPALSGEFTGLTSVGVKYATPGSSLVLGKGQAGWYWIGTHYVVGATAPGTAPVFSTNANQVVSLPTSNAANAFSNPGSNRGRGRTGQTSLTTSVQTTTVNFGAVGDGSVPIIGLRKAA